MSRPSFDTKSCVPLTTVLHVDSSNELNVVKGWYKHPLIK